MTDPLTAIAAVKNTEEALGVIAKLAAKLRSQPDVAAVKLAAALNEILKTYYVVDEALTCYASLAIDENALTYRSRELLSIAGGSLSVQVEKGRGSCSKIYNIYQAYLKRWFERVFNLEEQLAIERAFILPGGLGDADDTLFLELSKLVEHLETDAKDVLSLIVKNAPDEGRQRIWQTYLTLLPVQQAMVLAMRKMFGLRNELIEMTKNT